MSIQSLPDADRASIELLRLERQEQDLAHALDVIANRHERFPNDVTDAQLEQMRATHAAIRRRMLELRAFLMQRA